MNIVGATEAVRSEKKRKKLGVQDQPFKRGSSHLLRNDSLVILLIASSQASPTLRVTPIRQGDIADHKMGEAGRIPRKYGEGRTHAVVLLLRLMS